MNNGHLRIEKPVNEATLSYDPESTEYALIKARLTELKNQEIEIPLIIGGKEVRTGNLKQCIIPHNHQHVLARYHIAGEKEIDMAINASLEAQKEWQSLSWEHRASIFWKAAELLSTSWRATLNAATMLCQSKTVHQAEIDSACELIDFLRFNVYFIQNTYDDQPISINQSWNRIDYRPLEGFVFAVTPFNFTAIGGNLPTAPALLGNTVVWKPASSAVYSNYFIMKLLQEAGLPDGVINFVPCQSSDVGNYIINNKNLAGIHFTGSTETFQIMWKQVAQNIDKYINYPRLVGETGGKDFIFAHESADIDSLAAALIRGAFEYQGQKCSAASRAYIPRSTWNKLKNILIKEVNSIKVGNVEYYTNFMGAVIDKKSFDKISKYIDYVHQSSEAEVIVGGSYDDSSGYFIEPTIILTTNPNFKTMEEEIFGPVLTIYVYENHDFEKVLEICNSSSPYALTGAIFANDRKIISFMEQELRYAAGNFYINDKPTGAVVGQQPFGGSRKSGTNDKAGGPLNLLRWVNPRTIKETFTPAKNYRY